MRSLKRSAPIACDMSLSDFQSICIKEEPCFYCNEAIRRDKYMVKSVPGVRVRHGIYLDRIDASKSYSVDNVVPCCGPCNMTRATFVGFHEMQVLAAVRKGDSNRVLRLMVDYKEQINAWAAALPGVAIRNGSESFSKALHSLLALKEQHEGR